MKKTLIIIIIIIAVALGAYFYVNKQAKAPADGVNGYQSQQPTSPAPTPTPGAAPNIQTNVKGTSGADYTPSTTPTGGENAGSNVQVTEVDYDGSSFSPATVKIKAGDWVFFKNKGTSDFWPASDPHPTHTDYPGFDALQPISPGGEYKFQFTKVGSWGYHDHLNPVSRGTVVVSQ